MSLELTNYLQVGSIGQPYGIHGKVKINSYTAPPENILTYQPWHLQLAGKLQTFTPTEKQIHSNKIIVKLQGYDSPETVRQLSGTPIYIERNQLPKLPKDEYYWADLIGLTVIDTQNQILGIVKEMLETGSNDVLVVQGKKRCLIPYLDDVILKVDLEAKTIHVDWEPIT